MKYIKWALTAGCIFFILSQTIIGRSVQDQYIFRGLFWEARNGMWSDIRLNIILFIPLGFLVGGWKGLITGFVISCGIEAAQYFGRLGYCEMDDVLNNTIGSGIGAGMRVLTEKYINNMGLRKWEDLPAFMRCDEVRPYWEILNQKRGQLILKRIFDFCISIILLIILAVPMLVLSVIIKMDSEGTVFYRQERVTAYGKRFRIHKFRTMVSDADKIGTAVTVENDNRITKVGAGLRRYRLDELPQLFDVLRGDMSFVGTRPEVLKYVKRYRNEWYATFLMPAGITSECSIRYKDEDKLMKGVEDVDEVYVNQVLPAKMMWNLKSIRRFCIVWDILTMLHTITSVLDKDYG